jgi:hypothetical protein
MLPKLNVLNNAIVNATNGSPMKAGVSDGTSGFARGRMMFSHGASSTIDPTKKYFGSKDASSLIERRKYQAIGKVGINRNNEPLSFISTKDVNDTSQALTRVRAGGYMVPPKVRYLSKL